MTYSRKQKKEIKFAGMVEDMANKLNFKDQLGKQIKAKVRRTEMRKKFK